MRISNPKITIKEANICIMSFALYPKPENLMSSTSPNNNIIMQPYIIPLKLLSVPSGKFVENLMNSKEKITAQATAIPPRYGTLIL
jgi:hypothetical protein